MENTAAMAPSPHRTYPACQAVKRLPMLLERFTTFTPPAAVRVSSLARRMKTIIKNVPVPGP